MHYSHDDSSLATICPLCVVAQKSPNRTRQNSFLSLLVARNASTEWLRYHNHLLRRSRSFPLETLMSSVRDAQKSSASSCLDWRFKSRASLTFRTSTANDDRSCLPTRITIPSKLATMTATAGLFSFSNASLLLIEKTLTLSSKSLYRQTTGDT